MKLIRFLLYLYYISKTQLLRLILILQKNFQHPMQNNQQSLDQQTPQDSGQSNQSSINQQQLAQALKTLKKLKHIQKAGKLNNFKKTYTTGNQVFNQMSSFFHQKRNHIIQQKKLYKQERKKLRRKQCQTSINSIKKFRFKDTSHQLQQLCQAAINDTEIQFQAITHQLPVNIKVQAKCHICKEKYSDIHPFYGKLCPNCAQLNISKRNQKANLTGLTALVTGARIKIGYQIALKLLRDGATVFATSRFKNDTLLRYQSEEDYHTWKQRLHIIQCDFMSQMQVQYLIHHLKENVTKLDILINNAAQTIIRPKQFYSLQLQKQKLTLQYPSPSPSLQLSTIDTNNPFHNIPSLITNQIALQPGQIDLTNLDEFGQPTDFRPKNSWKQRIEQVSLLDCYTTQVINSIVPFHLISQLRSIMNGPNPSWVINVSSMEGVFYRPGKQQYHPHTNMAKASLNMITRTCAHQFLKDQIYMNSVDTGWVTNQNPQKMVQRMQQNLFKCPLDCVDGAMRVLDPIYQGVLHNQYPVGQFLKNYVSSFW